MQQTDAGNKQTTTNLATLRLDTSLAPRFLQLVYWLPNPPLVLLLLLRSALEAAVVGAWNAKLKVRGAAAGALRLPWVL